MSFWSSDKIRQNLTALVQPHSEQRISQGAYELSLGPEVYLAGESKKTRLDLGDFIRVRPGQIAVLLTEEQVRIPDNALGFISLKSTAKLPGLVNVSGFHVDPGFRGRLMFTVYNAGTESCTFARGDPLFLIWIADMDSASEAYKGKNLGLMSIRSEVVSRLVTAGASLPELNARTERLEKSLAETQQQIQTFTTRLLTSIIVALAIGGATVAIKYLLTPWVAEIPARQSEEVHRPALPKEDVNRPAAIPSPEAKDQSDR